MALEKRARILKEGIKKTGPVIYWMSRDQRVNDNWALVYAQKLALRERLPLGVVFCLVPEFISATFRQYSFMIEGLKELCDKLNKKNIPFFLLKGYPGEKLPDFIKRYNAGFLITDFNPLRIKTEWEESVLKMIDIPFYQVDAHNIVPCWLASSKQEFNARTFRNRINKILFEFLVEYPKFKRHNFNWVGNKQTIDWNKAYEFLNVDRTVKEVDWIKPGEKAAIEALKNFLKRKLSNYHESRNNPNLNGQSNLSPYLHFGHISAQRVALEIMNADVNKKSKDAFLEELIVRRELADNYCFYNRNYDNFLGLPEWARKTLNIHRNDKRGYIYNLSQFENAETHDDLWNAAQMEMVKKGKMHGYMRMYWAKKILEWTESPEIAMKYAIYLNDKYELDGRDPNGYTGIAWSIGGLHDRAWSERPIFGKVRYMSYNGCKTKFDVKRYIEYVRTL